MKTILITNLNIKMTSGVPSRSYTSIFLNHSSLPLFKMHSGAFQLSWLWILPSKNASMTSWVSTNRFLWTIQLGLLALKIQPGVFMIPASQISPWEYRHRVPRMNISIFWTIYFSQIALKIQSELLLCMRLLPGKIK